MAVSRGLENEGSQLIITVAGLTSSLPQHAAGLPPLQSAGRPAGRWGCDLLLSKDSVLPGNVGGDYKPPVVSAPSSRVSRAISTHARPKPAPAKIMSLIRFFLCGFACLVRGQVSLGSDRKSARSRGNPWIPQRPDEKAALLQDSKNAFFRQRAMPKPYRLRRPACLDPAQEQLPRRFRQRGCNMQTCHYSLWSSPTRTIFIVFVPPGLASGSPMVRIVKSPSRTAPRRRNSSTASCITTAGSLEVSINPTG